MFNRTVNSYSNDSVFAFHLHYIYIQFDYFFHFSWGNENYRSKHTMAHGFDLKAFRMKPIFKVGNKIYNAADLSEQPETTERPSKSFPFRIKSFKVNGKSVTVPPSTSSEDAANLLRTATKNSDAHHKTKAEVTLGAPPRSLVSPWKRPLTIAHRRINEATNRLMHRKKVAAEVHRRNMRRIREWRRRLAMRFQRNRNRNSGK